jgi:hypothetical protein
MRKILDALCRLFGLRCVPPDYTIRVWALGDYDKGIFPTQAAFEKLAGFLARAQTEGKCDFIWGPDLKVMVVKGEVTTVEPVTVNLYTNGAPPQETA